MYVLKKIMLIVFCSFLLTGCEGQIITEKQEQKNNSEEVIEAAVDEASEAVIEEETEVDLAVSDAVLSELEEITGRPTYVKGKKVSDGYTREDYESVTKIEDGVDKFFTYEITMKNGEKSRVSFRKFLIED